MSLAPDRHVRLAALPVAFLVGVLGGVAEGASAVDVARLRVPLTLQGGWDTPLGTGGLSLGAETAGGFGIGAGFGLSDAVPGALHQHVAAYLRAPILHAGSFELGGLLWASRGDRERERNEFLTPKGTTLIRWEWRPAYRVDLALSARLRRGAFAIRLDAGVGYVANAPACEYVDVGATTSITGVDCADPRIPAAESATSPRGQVAPFVALAGEYDLGAAPGAVTASAAATAEPAEPIRDARETNAWLAPTALTLPAGTVRLTAYEIVAPDLAVGITDRFQASVGLGIFTPYLAWQGQLKFAIVNRGRVRLALLGAGIGLDGQYNFSIRLVGAGGVASVCLDEACESLLSLALVAGAFTTHGESRSGSTGAGFIASPSLVIALGPRAKLVMELHTLPVDGDTIGAFLLRLPFRHLGIEIGVLTDGTAALPAGSVSWRF